MTTPTFDPSAALANLDAAAATGQLTAAAARSIRQWLTEPRYAEYAPEVARQIAAAQWKDLDDAFWTVIPFGTGGRRGRMYPIGTNAINDRTIGESVQGLADYVNAQFAGQSHSCAIGYDTRHRSRHFAELCGEVLVANRFTVYFLDGFRSTPELSLTVRRKRCTCGIMVTASHNPPADNAVKMYWSGGVQVLPPHDQGIIDRVMNVGEIRRTPFAEGVATGRILMCQREMDAEYLQKVRAVGVAGPRKLKIVYSPLHGVGATSVLPALAADGFADVELYGPHAEPDGDFPNVPGHVANPENAALFEPIIERAKQIGADLILATDPDADRLGSAAPLSTRPLAPWGALNGNQIAVLLTDFLLDCRRQAGTLTPAHYVVKTLVTTEMVRRIADYYGVRTLGNLQVGFKWIGQTIDEAGPDGFVFGCEESHGYLVGPYVRDKDAAGAAVCLAELAARLKGSGETLHGKLDALYWQFGHHAERQMSLVLPGSQGMQRMQALMARFRHDPPDALIGQKVSRVRDYLSLWSQRPGGPREPLVGTCGDMVMVDFAAEANYLAVRPSGTEPKLKFYLFAYEPPEQIANLDDTRAELALRLDAMERELARLASAE